ncbi:MAG TPA: ATP-binding protein [Vicinamibacteria bacterium]|nr:ATP-binding protein [Vicinamibacteria bacterium]
MTAGLTAGITAAVAIACAVGAYVYSVHHFRTLIASERATALAQGEIMRAALEHQMMENDRSLIAQMVGSFGKEPRVARVVLLDRQGVARFSSAPVRDARELELRSPTCQACHRLPPERRDSSQVIETGDETILRTMIPFRNHRACHRCHDPGHRINGVMLFDLDVGGIRAEVNRDLRWLVAGTGAFALLLILLLAIVVRVFVLRRLQRFETTARLIAGGDLAQRIPAEGSDTVSWLASEFNAMADSVTGLVGEVRSERERLETVINSIDDGIVVLDPQRKIIAANDAFLQRSGSVREEALGCSCRDVTPSLCTGDCPTLACLGSGLRQVRLSERRKPDGSVAWEEVHASPIRGPQGELLQVVEVWRDITERRATEARLAESHRLASLGQLASGFSHEMNTPLATVLTCVEGILRDARAQPASPEWAGAFESATVAREQILRCRGITQHFLRLSRGQSSADIVDLEQTLRAVARLVEPFAREHGVRIDVGPLAPGLHVRADESELQHALINLVLNAVQACRPGGYVALTAERDQLLRLRVTDDGCGIPADQRTRIFEPFVSLRKGGSGLGLFLSLNFVRRWGGDIAIESEPGRGSTFEIRLPPATSALEGGLAS